MDTHAHAGRLRLADALTGHDGFTLSYDPEADALYLRVSNSLVAATTEHAATVNLDYGHTGLLVGIEILGVLPMP